MSQRWALLCLIMLLGACTANGQPDVSNSQSVITVKDGRVLAKDGRLPTDSPAWVGVLLFNVEGDPATPSQYCLEDGQLYKGATYRLGRTNVFFSTPLPKNVINQPTIVYGTRKTGLDRKLTAMGPCPPVTSMPTPQMRSDWVADEADWRGNSTTARLARTEYIEATAVYPFPMVATYPTPDSTQMALQITNPFSRPLPSSIKFSLYFEGGSGKPMPILEPRALGNLAPGKTITHHAPKPVQKLKLNARRQFRGYRIAGTIDQIVLDLWVHL